MAKILWKHYYNMSDFREIFEYNLKYNNILNFVN